MTTPARRQYDEIKAQHPDALLLFRMGDFYELFDDAARIAAHDLHIALTSRKFDKDQRAPMAGTRTTPSTAIWRGWWTAATEPPSASSFPRRARDWSNAVWCGLLPPARAAAPA